MTGLVVKSAADKPRRSPLGVPVCYSYLLVFSRTAAAEGFSTKLVIDASIQRSMIKWLLMSEWVSASDQYQWAEINACLPGEQRLSSLLNLLDLLTHTWRVFPQCFASSCCHSLQQAMPCSSRWRAKEGKKKNFSVTTWDNEIIHETLISSLSRSP